MDFGFAEADNKSAGGAKDNVQGDIGRQQQQEQQYQGHGDHSPSKLIDISDDGEKIQQHLKSDGSGSTDDFEHVYHDPFIGAATTKTDTHSSVGGKSAMSAGGVGEGGVDLMDDFLGTTKDKIDNFKNDAFSDFQTLSSAARNASNDLLQDLESTIDKKINQTIDFMAAERGDGITTTTASQPIKPISEGFKSSYADAFASPPQSHDDYQKEHYNPSPVKKSLKDESDEKFISSEDLLGDFKDERMKTPEHRLKSQPAKVESSNIQYHSGIEDLTSDPLAAVPSVATKTKDDISKISSEETIKKPNKTEETIVKPAKPIDEVRKSSIEVSVDKKKKIEPASQMISAEEIFYRFGLDTWFKPERLHPKVESLIYWRDVKKSGIVFGTGLLILLAISCFSVISVFAYSSLLVLAGTILFRIYKTVMGAVQKTSEGHPFKEYLEMDLNLPHEKVQQIVNVSVAHVNGFVSELRRLFLVEDLVDSIKFGVILWVLTYVGSWFNGMTLVILAFVSLFTLPKVYENNKQSIDTYLDLVRSKILEITDKVKAAIPIGKKPETDKDK